MNDSSLYISREVNLMYDNLKHNGIHSKKNKSIRGSWGKETFHEASKKLRQPIEPNDYITMKPSVFGCSILIQNLPNQIRNTQELDQFMQQYRSCIDIGEVFVNEQQKTGYVDGYNLETTDFFKEQIEQDLQTLHPMAKVRLRREKNVVWVKGFGVFTTNETLFRAFSVFGHVTRARVAVNPASRKSKRWGRVEFADRFVASKCVEMCQKEPFIIDNTCAPVIVEPWRHSDWILGHKEDLQNPHQMPGHLWQGKWVEPHFVDEYIPLEFEFAKRFRELREREAAELKQVKTMIGEYRRAIINAWMKDREKLQPQMMHPHIYNPAIAQQISWPIPVQFGYDGEPSKDKKENLETGRPKQGNSIFMGTILHSTKCDLSQRQ